VPGDTSSRSDRDLPPELGDRLLALLACDDDEANAGLDELCEEHPEHAEQLRDAFAAADADDGELDEEPMPERVGPFTIARRIATGGMGTVYLAVQHEVDDRPVAVKLIRPGCDTGQLLARFEVERRVLAKLDHPNIARVYAAGATDDGRPYFAMEYVDGESLKRFCVRERLGLRARLRLFDAVCGAVMHAHLRGIVHRDLKPSNVLVVRNHRPLVPKVIDFGLARALFGDEAWTERERLTQPGAILGTLAYMSPEQLDGSGNVDTRSDVWALGVMLYELLSGRLPFEQLVDASPWTASELLRSLTLVVPSKRARSALRARQPTPVPARALRGDLDAIVSRCLERDPSERYQTVRELAVDLRRYLAGQPVLARRATAAYRLTKLCRRHRGLAAAAAAFVIISVGGGIGTHVGRLRAEALGKQESKARTRASTSAEAFARHRKRFDLLAWKFELRRAREARDELRRIWPRDAARLRAYLEEHGEPLTRAREVIEQALTKLRDLAKPVGAEPRRESPEDRERRRRLAALDAAPIDELQPEVRASVAAEKAELHEQLEESDNGSGGEALQFQNDADRFLYDTLVETAGQLQRFCDHELPAVRKDLAWVETVRARSIDAHAAQWRRACEAIARGDGKTAHESYRGLRLTPQLGLVPIGMNPRTKLWEFAHLRSGTVSRDGRVGPNEGIVFVLLPKGRFHMGAQAEDASAPNYDPDARPAEGPVTVVELDAFFLSKYEMTQGQWLRLGDGTNPSRFHAGRAGDAGPITLAHPVENVSWTMAQSLLARHGLVLPTEAQWEYAARAGTDTPWWCRDEPRALRATDNLLDERGVRLFAPGRTDVAFLPVDDGFALHAPVGSFLANPFGLYDVHGNVSEWCLDPVSDYRAIQPRAGDGLRERSDVRGRCLRGGSMWTPAKLARCSARRDPLPNARTFSYGLRPARRIRE